MVCEGEEGGGGEDSGDGEDDGSGDAGEDIGKGGDGKGKGNEGVVSGEGRDDDKGNEVVASLGGNVGGVLVVVEGGSCNKSISSKASSGGDIEVGETKVSAGIPGN